MKPITTISVAIFITLICIQGYRTIEGAGLLYPIEPHFSGQCKAIEGVTGAEDITIDHANQFAYISADDRRAIMAGAPVSGGIYGLSLSSADATPILLTEQFSDDFHPHGISLYHGDNGTKSLFVINHLNSGKQQVEIFDISSNDQLTHRQSITYPELITPNDLVAVGPSQFYATNDHRYPRDSIMQAVEDYLGLPLSTVSYFDGKEGQLVASGFQYSNGIAITPDLKTVYVAEIMGRKINVFERDLNDGSLTKQGEIPVNTGADNLEWDDKGNLWLGAHPRLLDFVAHAKDITEVSPSQVIKIELNSAEPKVSEVYLSDGSDISGSTVGAVSGETLLIGSVFEDWILRCRL